MKKISKKTIILALSLILCFSVSIGIATAYFTDYESAKGGAVLNLSGQTQISETMSGNDKQVVIANVGETDMIVRVKAIGNSVTATNTSGWVDGNDGWWYWDGILKGSKVSEERGKTGMIKFEVTFAEGSEPDTDVIVVHEASRTVYDVDADGNTVLVKPNGWAYVPAVQQ